MDILMTMTGWHWFGFALILFGLELFAPAAFFLWLGVAALLVAILMFVSSLSIPVQFVLFAILSPLVMWGGRRFYNQASGCQKSNHLNQRGLEMVGLVLTLEQPITNGQSRITIGDSTWKVLGADASAGTEVKVTAVRGNALVVETLSNPLE
ncbi:MAG: NfeD family protein [Alphaproteobacteria bacterium]|jgi:membrane protein implicated in regulation of membrane protease activity|nr:NfeD family protein [Alphaproteobacteria bacterium]